jgi:hypothetical protein
VNNQLQKNRLTILLIFGLAIIPFAIAWFYAKHPDKVKIGTNNGELISPVITTTPTDFVGLDDFTAQNLSEIEGHWVLINWINGRQCQVVCQDAIYRAHQISLMVGKDVSRIRRAVIMTNSLKETELSKEWKEDARLLKFSVSPELHAKIANFMNQEEGGLVLMDPLGNLMMRYPTNVDPYQIRNDLVKLLKISQIG